MIGAVLAVTTTYYFEQRGENREFDQAARVIDEELLTNAAWLQFYYEQEQVPPLTGVSPVGSFLPTDAWTDYRGALARQVSDETWNRLTIAYFAINVARPILLRLEAGTPLSSSYKKRISDVCRSVDMARLSLNGSVEVGTVGCEPGG